MTYSSMVPAPHQHGADHSTCVSPGISAVPMSSRPAADLINRITRGRISMCMHSQRYQSSGAITGGKRNRLSAGVLSLSAAASLLFAQHAFSAEGDEVMLDELTVEADARRDGATIEKTAARKAAGSKNDAPVMETPFSITVVDEEFMADSGAKNI